MYGWTLSWAGRWVWSKAQHCLSYIVLRVGRVGRLALPVINFFAKHILSRSLLMYDKHVVTFQFCKGKKVKRTRIYKRIILIEKQIWGYWFDAWRLQYHKGRFWSFCFNVLEDIERIYYNNVICQKIKCLDSTS